MASHYDITIIGLGCAGSHLIQALIRNGYAERHRILVLERSKFSVGKTWCFWERGTGNWDDLITQKWSEGKFFGENGEIDLSMGDYRYKMMESEKFIAFAKASISNAQNIDLVYDAPSEVNEKDGAIEISTQNGNSYTTGLLFDSRPPKELNLPKHSLIQHFKGWFIEVEQPTFSAASFTMMDYRMKDPGTTSFMYCLPISSTRALIEFTYFTLGEHPTDTYEAFNEKYINQFLGIQSYQVYKTEAGVLPMTTYNFQNHDSDGHIHIGTAGGWLKPSSGYSFKYAEKYSEEIAQRLKKGQPIKGYADRGRFIKYDETILRALSEENARGPALYEEMYRKNKTSEIFKFLDEETALIDELKVMASMTSRIMVTNFIRSFFS